ncbi:glycosyltransferase family 4 protein [Croceicoccus bisphenolivorans]|uniref:glycosyltransferase family 4 protein n=1 Tax=Croceicoccus bisphenolivorans TaxID=1783232 RepID=UPI00082BFEB7|nr:glycosyltransferase family 4 protein [Croceicoccus bisphenolivorans]
MTSSHPASPRETVRATGSHIVLTVNVAWNLCNFRSGLVSALLADGHRLTVLAPLDDSVTTLAAMGCEVCDLPMDRKGLNPVRDAGLLRRMSRAFGTLRPDVVLGFTIKNNIYGALAARRHGIAFLPNVTGLGTAFLSGGAVERIATMLYRQAFRAVPRVFFQNRDDLSLFIERKLVEHAQTVLLPGSGIDLDRFAPSPPPASDSGPVFLMIARLLRDKGVHEYVEAARIVRSRYPGARFQLLGAAGDANRTAIDLATVHGWERSHGIEYLGTSSDVRREIAAAHCVVLPSYREGAPRTLIEAAAMARPLIATDVPGCREVVDDTETGLLCSARSSESLARACTGFIAMPPAAQTEMGRAGRAKMEREYDQQIVIDAYRTEINRLARATGRHAASSENRPAAA